MASGSAHTNKKERNQMTIYTCSKCGESDLGMYGHYDSETDGFACDKKKADKMNDIIDIAKKYTTRDGREVVVFEVSDRVYCKIRGKDGDWFVSRRELSGRLCPSAESDVDLIPVKTWRAWKYGEAPRFFMAQTKTSTGAYVAPGTGSGFDGNFMLENYIWLHEDGTTTPCGVLE